MIATKETNKSSGFKASVTLTMVSIAIIGGFCAGCDNGVRKFDEFMNPGKQRQAVPYPINLQLPKEIKIHPAIKYKIIDQAKGTKIIEVFVEAVDSDGDPTKAYGKFAFQLCLPGSNQGAIATWDSGMDLTSQDKNRQHWDKIKQKYAFRLNIDQQLPAGRQLVLVATYTSDFTPRLTSEANFVP